MGLKDIFKGRKNEGTQGIKQEKAIKPYDVITGKDINGNDSIVFKKNYQTLGETNNITELSIGSVKLPTNKYKVYSCRVGWYNADDTIFIDGPTDYEDVFVGLELGKLKEDPAYLESVMNILLDRKRVKEIVENSLKESSQIISELAEGRTDKPPCGRYIGRMKNINGQYKEDINVQIGKWAHNLPEMVEERDKKRRIRTREQLIAQKRAEIAKLQKEIDTEYWGRR